jgi:hypothetical protein
MILGTAAALRRHGSGWPPGFAHDGVDAARDDGLDAATPFGDISALSTSAAVPR